MVEVEETVGAHDPDEADAGFGGDEIVQRLVGVAEVVGRLEGGYVDLRVVHEPFGGSDSVGGGRMTPAARHVPI